MIYQQINNQLAKVYQFKF